MKALSVKQPWAWLIVNGHKDVENRTWKTNHTGPLAIHAGLKFDMLGYEWVQERFPDMWMPKPADFDRGGFVGTVNLVNCTRDTFSIWHQRECIAWVLAEPETIKFKPFKGKLGLFNIDL